ncbi:putative DnaJ domain protein [Aspergillus saccharolyticus JOP 1030-1]|uniref:DnaJ-domain-containing protein n=1 Tax=Aspergillus saccharolyticus JOP 1030-1 TaxID=1450539 RepID=A0A319A0K6_9EURO|nr:DnaJ-domain-containing protein [Aspergillus saccharolyticus JOP 1030-1]PYH45828.1 DnaJ-domain-containing protein [Aspergillus saccharolyticus JOP 1030-1]
MRTLLLLVALTLCLVQLVLAAEDYYKTLGLDKSASEKDIKRAYRTLSKKFHPDKNPGDDTAREKFVLIAEAYDILSTPTTRKIYDQYGHEGIEQHRQGGAAGGGRRQNDPFDLFSRFFGGGGHFGHAPGHRRGPDMELKVGLPLRDFYNGREVSFGVEKQQICDACEGTGSADREVVTCDKCAGRGVVIQKHQLAPGMFQQVQMHCDKCGGQGKTVKKPCPMCAGQRVVRKEVETFASIEPGMGKGTRIVFENEADESPDWIAGDLVLILEEREPELVPEGHDGTFFRRKGRDLFWKEALSLREAWMGEWTRNITHLDGHVVQVGRQRGQVVQPLAVETVKGEGMPYYAEGHLHESADEDEAPGDLYIEYTVILPDEMESGMEKDFFALWEKWRKKNGVNLDQDSGRPVVAPRLVKDEL